MKMKAFFLALAVAGAAAAFGLTATGRSDTGTTTGTTTTVATTTTGTTTTGTTTTNPTPPPLPNGCRRFELRGTVASVSGTSLVVNVTKGNKEAKTATGTSVTVAADSDTKVEWQGRGTFAGPNAGDDVSVNGKVCNGTYTANHVEARTAKPKKAEDAKPAAPKHGDAGDSGEHGNKHK